MSPVITLRACLVAGGVALAVALTGCAGTVTEQDPHGGIRRLHLDLPVAPMSGTDAGLISTPANPLED